MDCVHRLVADQVRRTPDLLAVRDATTRLTYRELAERAHQVAHALIAAGVRVESRVGIFCTRGVDMIVAMLGTIYAGAAYVPLEPTHPDKRIEIIVADAKLTAVVTQQALMARVGQLTRCVLVDGVAQHPVHAPDVAIAPDNAIYVLYTSGSTGVPKGVVGEHRAVASRLRWQRDSYPFAAGEIASARTPLGFVDSVAEIFAPLAFGVPLVVLDDESQRDVERALATLAETRATRIVLVPSLLATILDVTPNLAARVPALHYWFVGGEPAPVALVARFMRQLPGRKLINIYGATELTADATHFDFDRMPSGLTSSPIGVPLTGVFVRIVDDGLSEVADGTTGEIVVSGVCVARGYLDRPELTAERFVANPFPEGGLLYRTRDLGKRLPTGDVQYLGRLDSQVKIRGMRVELGEVEALVATAPGVAHAVALARDERLVVFVTADRAIVTAEVRAHVAAQVPDYLVPNDVFQLEAFPRNANGKVDRAALRSWQPPAADVGALPASANEHTVARIWEDVLGISPIGRAQNFFDLGGSSLAAMRVVARLREHYRVQIPIAALFERPTIAGLAERLAGQPSSSAAMTPSALSISCEPLPGTLPLSYYQLPFWLFRALTGDTSVVADVFAFAERVDVERLQAAYSAAVASFDALWMRYPRWRPLQKLQQRRPCRFSVHDGAGERDLVRHAEANVSAPFDLDDPPHIHARLVRLPAGDRLIIAVPHVAVDMASLELFRAALEARYLGERMPAPRCASLADLVAFERATPPREEDARYWQRVGQGAAWVELPARLCATTHGDRVWAERLLAASQVDELERYARRHATSLPLLLVGSIYAAIGQVAGCDDPDLLVMFEKRDRQELQGLFTNLTALLRCRITGARGPVADVVRRVGAQLVTSMEHSDSLMRRPTQWNDFWSDLPRPLRGVARALSRALAAGWPEARLAPETFTELLRAIVPPPRRASGLRHKLIAVNILPEVVNPASRMITRCRSLPMMLRPEDLLVGTDPLLDRTLQIHVTRDDRGLAVNLYGGGLHQAGLDELGRNVVAAIDQLVASERMASA